MGIYDASADFGTDWLVEISLLIKLKPGKWAL